jgi:NAD(P)-dependent dehydrogenase (short-subunit alcohol dehydrogenase family)
MKGTDFRVNSVSPGGLWADQEESFLEKYRSHCSKKGMLNPEDITGAINFLLSDQSSYVCGQNIVVDDGFTI